MRAVTFDKRRDGGKWENVLHANQVNQLGVRLCDVCDVKCVAFSVYI